MTADLALPLPIPSFDRRIGAGAVASALLHVGLIVLAIAMSPLRQLVVPAPAPVAVEIVTERQLDALNQPLPTPAPAQLTAPVAPATAAPIAPSAATPGTPTAPGNTILGIHIATQFYAGAILNEPAMRKIRAGLETFAPSERMVQLCNMEGLEQIKRASPGTDPNALVGYAMSDPVVAGLTLSAAGGAFRSRRKWYGIAFKCTVAADLESVTAFEFKLGAAIPEYQWEAHNLNATDEDDDDD